MPYAKAVPISTPSAPDSTSSGALIPAAPRFGGDETSAAHHRRVSFVLFAAGWGANHFASMLIVYRSELGFSSAALGQIFGAYALGLVPGLILAGKASDRWGRRSLVLPAGAVAIAASGVLAFGQYGFPVLLLGRLIYGLAMGCVMSPGSVWVQELSEPKLGPRRATLALSAGFGLGPLVSGFVAEFAPAPLVLPYLVHAAVMTLGLLALRGVPETVQAKTSTELQTSGRRLGRRETSLLLGLLPSAPWAFGFPAIAMVVLPVLLRPLVARPVIYSASLAAVSLFTGVLVQPLTSRLGSRGDLLGLALGALGIVLGTQAVRLESPLLVYAVAPLVGAGYGLVMTTGLRYVSERAPVETRGTVVGIYYVLTYLGFALPFLHAVGAERFGDVTTLHVAAGLAFTCLVLRARGFVTSEAAPSANEPRPQRQRRRPGSLATRTFNALEHAAARDARTVRKPARTILPARRYPSSHKPTALQRRRPPPEPTQHAG
jgi:MFS family permease